jgi:hypothetical protein
MVKILNGLERCVKPRFGSILSEKTGRSGGIAVGFYGARP